MFLCVYRNIINRSRIKSIEIFLYIRYTMNLQLLEGLTIIDDASRRLMSYNEQLYENV